MSELLRSIPKVDELISRDDLRLLAQETSREAVTRAAREVLARLREGILAGRVSAVPSADALAGEIGQYVLAEEVPSLKPVINATGVVLHTNLGRSPLAEAAIDAMAAVGEGYSTLEYNPDTGARGSRHSHVDDLLCRITGAEGALVVNNNAAAVLLILSALAKGREVVISRGELVEIGGSFRVPAVMEQSGCILREVGATNKTKPADYEEAIGEETAALLKVHPSNFRIVGFTQEVSLEELTALGKRAGLPVIHDLGSGALIPLMDEPTVLQSIAAGADLVCFSGDKLLGGPQAGIILGRRELIEQVKKHPLARAVRIDKTTLSALEATLRLYRDGRHMEIPTIRMLLEEQGALREKAARLLALLSHREAIFEAEDVEGQVGGGSAPGRVLPSCAVAVTPLSASVDELEGRLRALEVPVVARIARDRLILDVRTIEESALATVAHAVKSCL